MSSSQSAETVLITKHTPYNYGITGALSFNTIKPSIIQQLNFTAVTDVLTLDLQHVSKIDSAGLALLIEWLRIARAQQKKIVLHNIPIQLTALAKLSSLADIDLFVLN